MSLLSSDQKILIDKALQLHKEGKVQEAIKSYSELLDKNISKTEQSSDWGGELTKNQQKYAATDVLYLHKIKLKLDKMLVREKREGLAKACFEFIQHRTDLDLRGWAELDIFKH